MQLPFKSLSPPLSLPAFHTDGTFDILKEKLNPN